MGLKEKKSVLFYVYLLFGSVQNKSNLVAESLALKNFS